MKKCVFYLTYIALLSLPQALPAETSWKLSPLVSRLQLPGLTFKSVWSIPETSTNQTPELKTPECGLELQFPLLQNLSVQVKLGHLSPSGSLAKLKSPSLSSSSALAAKTGAISDLSVSLPSSTSQKPEAFSSQITFFPNSFLKTVRLNTFNDSQGTLLESAFAQLRLSSKTLLSFSALSGEFSKSNQGTSWFSSTSFFPSQNFFCHNLELGFSCPFFTARNNLNLYQCFTATPDFTFSSEDSFFYKDFTLNFAIFLAGSEEIFTTGSNRLKTIFQCRINPQMNFFPFENQLKIRTGLLFMMEEKIDDKNQKNMTGKTSFQTAFITKKTQVKMSLGLTGIELFESENLEQATEGCTITGGINTTSRGFLRPATNLQTVIELGERKYNLKASQKFTIPGKNSIWISASTNGTFKEEEFTEFKLKISAGGTIKTKVLQFKCTAGLSMDLL